MYSQDTKEHSIKRANRFFEYIAKLKYLGTKLTDQNFMHDEIKSRIKFRECLLPFGLESSGLPPTL
jgi:hypothetical protein